MKSTESVKSAVVSPPPLARIVRLSILTQYYPPDFAATGQLIEELANYLVEQKMEVQVFTGQPSYAFNAAKAPAHETKGQVRIQRSRITKTRKYLGRTIAGLLYSFRSVIHLLKSAHRGDVLLLTTEPPFLFVVGYIAHRLFKTPYICLIYDLYPDAVVEFGMASEGSWIVKLWNRINQSVWRRAESIIVLSETMKERVVNKAPTVAKKISIIHNWSDPERIKPIPKSENPFAAQHLLQDKFVVLYSGNMGRCHDLETIIDAAEELQNEPIHFVFIGAGPKRQPIMERVESLQLQNCLFLPYQDKEVLPFSLTACDLSLVSVGEGMEGVVAPSKFYSALACGRPIAAICEPHSYLRQLIADANCGAAFQPGDSKGLAAFIRHLAQDPKTQERMGSLGYCYVQNRFTPQLIGKQYLQMLERAVLKDSDLRRAIAQKEFQLFFQPIFSLRTGAIRGLEVLVHWQHPLRGLLPPSEFLNLAEETGCILEIGEHTFTEAFRQFRSWQKPVNYPLYLKLNLSQRQFFDPGLVPLLDRLMQEYDIAGSQISLDIPETVLLNDGAASTGILLRLKERQILICLDNFGQGTTSVRNLNHFPLNALELDRQLVRQLDFNPEADSLIESIIVLAREQNMDVIAEGIESSEQLGRLKALGTDFGKGYLLAVPSEAVQPMLMQLHEVRELLMESEDLLSIANEASDSAPLVLLVDNEREMRNLLRRALFKDGYRVVEAESGQEGLELYRQLKPDLILIEGMMPGLDGFACCRQIRAEEAERGNTSGGELPILMITALDDSASVARAFESGVTDYITKPLNWEIFRQRLIRLIGKPYSGLLKSTVKI
ncbi:MAG: EAL domain-containing protein [Thermosynechococcaceae cyanobacterium MS004]|nr:EAL domain-containing protein [Thermosynechococcaceae cyanobacterium MS004]